MPIVRRFIPGNVNIAEIQIFRPAILGPTGTRIIDVAYMLRL